METFRGVEKKFQQTRNQIERQNIVIIINKYASNIFIINISSTTSKFSI